MTRHVAPAETLPARLAPLAKLPIFLDLAGRKVVVAGSSAAVAWKAEMMAAAGAHVTVLAEAPVPELEALADSIVLLRRRWHESDLDRAMLAIAEEPDLAEAARARGILVNTIDQPAHCDFQFGTIVNRSPVVIGISTDGAAPILGQAIRRRIEAVLPAGLGAWTTAAKSYRARLKALVPSRTGRRRFWEKFVDAAFASPNREVGPGDLEALASDRAPDAAVGEVVIVGAGPGDPSLVTLGAMRELQAADVIVYDRLVTPEILELGRREARRILVGKQGHGAGCRQQDISALLCDLAREGQRVVRLKGGDPAIFGRTGEEVAACRTAGVRVRIVAGVTTASAAAASLGLSLTHRDHAQRVQFVTGHDRSGELPDLDLDALADPRATTVVYMGRRTARSLVEHLLARGLAPTTPVIVTTDVSRVGQRHQTMTLAALGDLPDGTAPTLILIGAALGLPDTQQS